MHRYLQKDSPKCDACFFSMTSFFKASSCLIRITKGTVIKFIMFPQCDFIGKAVLNSGNKPQRKLKCVFYKQSHSYCKFKLNITAVSFSHCR